MSGSSDECRTLYAATLSHWAHSEQVRWTLLYNYLMASTILLLAWATIFSGTSDGITTRLVLALLAVAGVIISCVWVGLGRRASKFVKMYHEAGLGFETTVRTRPGEPVDDSGCIGASGPFACADSLRKSFDDAKGLDRLAKWARSDYVVMLVPGIFVVVYTVLTAIALCWGPAGR